MVVGEPSIRSLAAALRVAPTAIYYHFPSQAAIYQSVVELVWAQATRHLLELTPRPLEADPVDETLGDGGRISEITAFLEPELVARFGLPAEIRP